MKSGRRFGKVFAFAVLFATLAFVSIGCASAATHYVDPGESIQAAVNAANSGDTIIVRDGTYTENINVYKRLTIFSENGSASTIVNAINSYDHVFEVTADWVDISGFTVMGATGYRKAGIRLGSSVGHYNISDNIASNNYGGICLISSSDNNLANNNASNNYFGIRLKSSNNNTVTSNIASNNSYGISIIDSSSNNTLTNNIANDNFHSGIYLYFSCNNNLTNNTANNHSHNGIYLKSSCNNNLTGNTANYNNRYGIHLSSSSSNLIYNNYFNNTNNAYDDGNNIWNITKTAGTNIIGGEYLGGNYWSDYAGSDTDGDGLGDAMLPYNSSGDIANGGDYLPLVKFAPSIFDTGAGTYPSIMGTHEGKIKPSCDITVSRLYTYPCTGTGGHTESIELYENKTSIASGTWNGYKGDWHNISITPSVTLREGHEYRYVIKTGSYPQIIHEPSKEVTGGTITCTQFTDANRKTYTDWIPAIMLEVEEKEIKIGIVAPLTGGASTTGQDMWQAAALAAEEINTQGGVNVNGVNMKITLVKGDTETSREGGVEAVTKLITEDKVDILVGGFSSGITYADQVVASEHKVEN
jgi:parallel beta-helix repeat protein